jgi:valyl-tRNA synthetase
MEASRRKLENEKFISRAKPEAVSKERSKAADLERQIASLDENLSALG